MHVAFIDRKGAHAIWRLIHAVAAQLRDRGDEVIFYRLDDGVQRSALELPDGIQLRDISVPIKRGPWDVPRQQVAFAKELRKNLSQDRPDLVHTNFCLPGTTARKVAKGEFGIPVVTTQHEIRTSMNRFFRWQVKATEKYADRIVHISSAVARSFGVAADKLSKPGVSGPHHSLIYNGVDVERIRALAGKVKGKISGRIVSVGRLVKEKGHDQLIRALPEIRKAHPSAHLVLIGAGPEEMHLRQFAIQLGLSECIQFRGWVEHADVIREMAEAELVAIPSRHEGFGMVLAEALAAGTPIVASRIPVFKELVGNGDEHVLLFENENTPHMAEQIIRSLCDVDAARHRAQSGIELVCNQFSIQQMSEAYIQLYDSLIESGKTKFMA